MCIWETVHKEHEMEIGPPTNVKHVAHVGFGSQFGASPSWVSLIIINGVQNIIVFFLSVDFWSYVLLLDLFLVEMKMNDYKTSSDFSSGSLSAFGSRETSWASQGKAFTIHFLVCQSSLVEWFLSTRFSPKVHLIQNLICGVAGMIREQIQKYEHLNYFKLRINIYF